MRRMHQTAVELMRELPQVLNAGIVHMRELFSLPHVHNGLPQGVDILVGAPLGGIISGKGLQTDSELQQIHQSVRRGRDRKVHLADQILDGDVAHIGAVSSAAVQNPHVFQDLQRLPDRNPADVEPLGQIPFRRDLFSAL